MATVDITSIVIRLTNKRVKELAERMRDEMKEIITRDNHIKTGNAYNSIRVYYNNAQSTGNFETIASGGMHGGFLTNVSIGSHELSAYYLDQGNGGSGTIIKAKHMTPNGRPGSLGVYPDGIPGYGWRKSVHGYDGIHFVKEVADRHR